MKTSQIAAKVAVRLFLFMVLLALVPFFTGHSLDKQLSNIYIATNNKWAFAYPLLLVLGFIGLLVMCSIKKYTKPDLNWLLVLNTLILITYGITFYIRLHHLINK